MIQRSFFHRLFAGAMIFIYVAAAVVQARPLPETIFFQKDDKHPLPPVNWVRSRTIDVKHIDVDLKFDWNKEQAVGVETITVAPFADSDKFSLDAAMMTIGSVTTSGGSALKFAYDPKKDNDNLEISLDRTYKGGEDVTVKIAYNTNYVNKAEGDTAIGGFGRGIRFIKPTADDPKKPRQIWSQGESEFNRYWFPSYDTPNDGISRYSRQAVFRRLKRQTYQHKRQSGQHADLRLEDGHPVFQLPEFDSRR
jgi:aminopeptidase N